MHAQQQAISRKCEVSARSWISATTITHTFAVEITAAIILKSA
jgi:hypothetical protein